MSSLHKNKCSKNARYKCKKNYPKII